MIAADDRGFTLGDGLFETLLSVDGRLRDADAHLDRMAAGCRALGLPDLSRAEAESVLAAAGAGPGRWAVRLTLSAGSGGRGLDRPPGAKPLLIATATASPRPTEPARLITAQVRRNDRSPAARLKTLSYLDNVLARAEATGAGADEALMLNTRDQIACATAANLFWIAGGELFTPALTCGALAGVTRAQVIAKAGRMGVVVREVAVGREALDGAEAVAISNSLIGLRGVASLDGRRLVGHALATALAEGVAA
jgi:branched-chain amino acid aminotransferase/4-amino-4-deoxychorismate lyase